MIKIKTFGEFMMLVLWVFLATWLINLIIDALDAFTPSSIPVKALYRAPYQTIKNYATPAATGGSTSGASGGS